MAPFFVVSDSTLLQSTIEIKLFHYHLDIAQRFGTHPQCILL